MLSLGRLRFHPDQARINFFLNQASPIILTILMSLDIFHGYLLIQQSNGGTDLVSADIPKSLMLLNGQNPYSTQPWASPYPPLVLLTVSGVIRLSSLFASQSSLILISQQIRFISLFADAAVALIIYLTIRTRTNNPLQSLIPAKHRYLTGTILLATATIFKIHPVLALPLVMIWLIRTQGLLKTLPSLLATTTITSLGLILPLAIPGYQQSILGFNLTNQGNGTTLTIMSLLNTILPQTLQFAPTELFTNQIWIATTATLYTIALGTFCINARSLIEIDIVLLGLVAWLIPLKIVYTHYIVWAVIPFLMRGRLKQTILVVGLLQFADTLAYWSSSPASGPFPEFVAFYGPVLTSLIIRLVGATALVLVLYSLRKNPIDVFQHRNLPASTAF